MIKKIILFAFLSIGLIFFSKTRDKKGVKVSETNDLIIEIKQNRFSGKVFEAGADNHFNHKEECAFYFECDCCRDILIFVDATTYYMISYCMADSDLTKGNYTVNDSIVKLVSDGRVISKRYNWALEVNPNAEPKYFIKDTTNNKYTFDFKIKNCNSDMLMSENKNGDLYIAIHTTNKKEYEFEQLKAEGFDKYINLN